MKRFLHLLLCPTLFAIRTAAAEPFDAGRFEKEIVVPACSDPMQMAIAPDGRVFFIERAGTLKVVEPSSRNVTVAGRRAVLMTSEIGLLGLALDRDFARTQALFLFFSPKEKAATLRLARFVLKDGKLDLDSEKTLLEYALERPNLPHQGGGLFMAENGDLLLGTGDSTPAVPELQIDERPGHATGDAQRTTANSMELRGKILRIHPTPDGGYTIPPGNLFPGGREGRAEIFAMGVRNGFRQFADAKTGIIYWGDVGQNITADIGVGPDGYDEVNQARAAGNFGWPYFTGPNEAYRKVDYATRTAGALFDVRSPRNDSPNNTGAKELPLPQPAFIWYPSVESKEFPMLGSGGRSAMTGPVYRFDPAAKSDLRLPEHFGHVLFIHDWMRNWIQAVHLDADERIARIEPFLPEMHFRKPIELKLASDGTLYVVETGDKWSGNTDSQIVRLVYRRGNRAPVAVASASQAAGKLPLKVRFDATRSTDKDGDALSYRWKFGDGGALGESQEAAPEFMFNQPGVHPVTLTVSDGRGASSTNTLDVRAGNAPPQLTIEQPANGGFYEAGQRIAYRIAVMDKEDGGTADGRIPAGRVTLETKIALRLAPDDAALPPGLRLMRGTTCFACHQTDLKSVGPAYAEIARKYLGDGNAREALSQKILTGGVGVWSKEAPMPPHPQHTLGQTRQMVDWILSLADAAPAAALTGLSGAFDAPPPIKDWRVFVAPVLQLIASYADNGAAGVPPLRGEAVAVLHPRRKKAALFDAVHDGAVVDVLEGREASVLRLKAGGWFRFDTMNLAGVTHLTCRVAPLAVGSYVLEARLDAPDGPLLGSEPVACRSENVAGVFGDVTFPVAASAGVHGVCFVARVAAPPSVALPASGRVLDVNWIDFRAGLAAVSERSRGREQAR